MYSFIHLSNNLGQGLIGQKVDNATYQVNQYPADSVVCFFTILYAG